MNLIRAGPSRSVVLDLALDPVQQPGAERLRCDEQVLVVALAGEPGQVVEQVADVVGDAFVGGQQAEVLVHPRGLGVVVAGADVGVAADAAALVADDEARACSAS